jgi:hypothetical protein
MLVAAAALLAHLALGPLAAVARAHAHGSSTPAWPPEAAEWAFTAGGACSPPRR